jgi:Flp pilus assembly pilin Flp
MKKLTAQFHSLGQKLWKDESGQGATEYILLLVVVVALGMMFRTTITSSIKEKLAELSQAISGFTVNGDGN